MSITFTDKVITAGGYSFDKATNAIVHELTPVTAPEDKAKAIKALEDAFAGQIKAGMKPEELAVVSRIAETHGVAPITEAIETGKKIEALAFTSKNSLRKTALSEAQIAELERLYFTNPDALNLVSADAKTYLNNPELGRLPSIIDLKARTDVFNKALHEATLTGKPSVAELEALVDKHGPDVASRASSHLKGIVGEAELAGAITATESKIAAAKADLAVQEGAIEAARKAESQVAKDAAQSVKDKARLAVTEAEEARAATLKANESISHHLGESAGKVASAEAKGAKWFTGGKLTSFRHTAETVGKDIEKIGKIRTPKVILATGAALGGIYLVSKAFTAGTGNTGPGEKAAEVNRSRENEPSMGRA